MTSHKLKIALVTEPLADRPLPTVMDWLAAEVPEIAGLEIGTGAYAPTGHCDMPGLLADPAARRAWKNGDRDPGVRDRCLQLLGQSTPSGFEALPSAHDKALRDTIRLASDARRRADRGPCRLPRRIAPAMGRRISPAAAGFPIWRTCISISGAPDP